MKHDPSPGPDERFVQQTERVRRELLDSATPVFALTGPDRPATECFAGTETFDDTITVVRIVHGDPTTGPWAAVDTARWADVPVNAGPLRTHLEHGMRLAGDRFSDVEWTENDTTVLVDDQPVPGRTVRAGHRWWATRCERDGVEITVTARDWHPATVHLGSVTDLTPLLDALGSRPTAETPPTEPVALPPDLAREPHRALIDAALRTRRDHIAWMADGGAPPHLPPYWSTLWQAAVRRQRQLTDQDEPDADRAVSDIVAHVTSIADGTTWFDEHATLRARAINEILLYGTGLGEGVSSHPAQRAWRERQHLMPRQGAPINEREAVDLRWRDAWARWADTALDEF
ncbi:hypothetical protein [Micromonospora sp. DT231]|uniref:hypothetical protein n=1 Tax=Micromonospora sp. DT231 TaxID=3416526 RepID=UPI003CF507A3